MIACFIGHRKISIKEPFISQLKTRIEELIAYENFDTFLFGSRSEFDEVCLKIVTELKGKYPNIKRVYVRSTYQSISDNYEKYLLTFYNETYIPDKITNAGKASYVERNQHMIDKSDLCVFITTKIICRQKRPYQTNITSHFLTLSSKAVPSSPISMPLPKTSPF